MKVIITKKVSLNGVIHSVGSALDVPEQIAEYLVAQGAAEGDFEEKSTNITPPDNHDVKKDENPAPEKKVPKKGGSVKKADGESQEPPPVLDPTSE